MKQFKNFYEGAYAKYILPGVLLQSVLIGGGYATGVRFILTVRNSERWAGSPD